MVSGLTCVKQRETWPIQRRVVGGDVSAAQMSRRSALGILAASAALAGLPGCRRPDIELRPYTKMPENVVPGMSLFYATTLTRGGSALPVLVETHEGRPTKVEGHPKYRAHARGQRRHRPSRDPAAV